MTEESNSADPQKAAGDRAKARRLFARAQECSAAAEYEEAMRLLKQIPQAYRGSDHERISNQVRERYLETEDLRDNLLAAMKKGKPPDVLLPMARRLVELKPGDEWANDLRHRLESQEQEESRPKPRRLSLGFGQPSNDQPQPLDEPAEELELVLEPIVDSPGHEESEDWDVVEPIALEPISPPGAAPAQRRNGAGRPPYAEPIEDYDDAVEQRPVRRSQPPPLPAPEDRYYESFDDEYDRPSLLPKILLMIVVFVLLALISVVIGILIARGPDGLQLSATDLSGRLATQAATCAARSA